MTPSGPTILALETDSAWVVILAVSLVTLVAVAVLRRLIGRPGGVASGILLSLPLVLPLVAAVVYHQAVLPEIAVLQPAASALSERSGNLLHLLLVANDSGKGFTPYALAGSAGPWVVLFGALFSSFMLLRRFAGQLVLRRLVRRSSLPTRETPGDVTAVVRRLAGQAGLKKVPEVLLLPPGSLGAFATGGRKAKVLICPDLLSTLEHGELEAVLAHEIAHIKSHDVQIVAAAGFLRDLVAWNPVAHVAYRKLNRNREFEADRRAAELTGDPLSVASSLVKMCELVKGSGFRHGGALAFFRSGARVRGRVSALLELSDGGAGAIRPATRLPYILAAVLAVVIGLESGAWLANGERSAFAIIIGSGPATESEPWRGVGALETKPAGGRLQADSEQRAKAVLPEGRDYPFRSTSLEDGMFSLKTRQISSWKATMKEIARRKGIPAPAFFSRTSAEIKAVPLVPESSSFGVYRMSLREPGPP